MDRSWPILAHSGDNLRRMLDLLAETDTRATLFVLGKFAERHGDAVRAAADAGHEIGSHGYGHVEVHRLTPAAFRADLWRAGEILAELTGRRPTAYRAPVFSIGRSNLWALRVLAEEGYTLDASIYPFDGPRYGIGDWPTEPRCVLLPDGLSIVEYPATVWPAAGRRWPISGGGYARLLPGAVLRSLMVRQARQRPLPPVFYCHPYEIDPLEISRHYPTTPWKRRLHQGLGRGGFEAKLKMLLERFACCSFAHALASAANLPTVDLSRPQAHTHLPATRQLIAHSL